MQNLGFRGRMNCRRLPYHFMNQGIAYLPNSLGAEFAPDADAHGNLTVRVGTGCAKICGLTGTDNRL
jgi:hypothetical protein